MHLTIGKIADRAGLGIETIRFYEKEGLLAKPRRSGSNYRLYPEGDIFRLRFIRRAKELGFSLGEIRELLQLHDDTLATKGAVRTKAEVKIADIRGRIKDLSRMLAALTVLVDACDGQGPIQDCPILHALEDPPFDNSEHIHSNSTTEVNHDHR
ncbi:MAG: heavy metal-responsive transcriptional regulator [Proteobacteria bacterium]|nr:heavy metal-responsive transcriptional regulator [Pseudomonadota bacterium]MBU1687580.1 heavy metal-responsive transcriptional regulator [Pseudomonadota bacterium]